MIAKKFPPNLLNILRFWLNLSENSKSLLHLYIEILDNAGEDVYGQTIANYTRDSQLGIGQLFIGTSSVSERFTNYTNWKKQAGKNLEVLGILFISQPGAQQYSVDLYRVLCNFSSILDANNVLSIHIIIIYTIRAVLYL